MKNCPYSIIEEIKEVKYTFCKYDHSVDCKQTNYEECPYYHLHKDSKLEMLE